MFRRLRFVFATEASVAVVILIGTPPLSRSERFVFDGKKLKTKVIRKVVETAKVRQ